MVFVDAIPHSHAYREDTILQCVAFAVARVGEIHNQTHGKNLRVGSPSELLPSIINNWLDDHTLLTNRTKREYAKIINVKSKKEITWS